MGSDYDVLFPNYLFLTENKTNMVLIKFQVQMCLTKVGAFLHTIQIEPISEYYNLFEFVRILNLFIEYHMDYRGGYPMNALVNFYFTFSCETREQSDVFVYGTGTNSAKLPSHFTCIILSSTDQSVCHIFD